MSEFTISDDGWLNSSRLAVQHIESPNFNQRPDENDICLIVVHNISLPPKQFGGHYIEQFFCNQLNPTEHAYFEEIKELKVSSHLLIKRDGSVIQFVPFSKRAWHAGASTWQQREQCNDFSIGIELEGADDIAYEDEQYIALKNVISVLQRRYPLIHSQSIVGHCDIAPERKTDPGDAFDWSRIKA